MAHYTAVYTEAVCMAHYTAVYTAVYTACTTAYTYTVRVQRRVTAVCTWPVHDRVRGRISVYTAVCGQRTRGQDRINRCVLGLYTAVCMARYTAVYTAVHTACTYVRVHGRVHGRITAVYGPCTCVHDRVYGCVNGP